MISRIKNLFLIFFMLMVSGSLLFSQEFGVGISYGSTKTTSAAVYYRPSDHQFHLGGSMQLPDTRGKPLDDPTGHGVTIENSGTYFYSADLGYARIIREKFPLRAVLSIGRKVHYINYLDSSFIDGGFHTLNENTLAIGLGADLGYNFRGFFEIFAGYHTLRNVYAGVRIPIPDFIPGG